MHAQELDSLLNKLLRSAKHVRDRDGCGFSLLTTPRSKTFSILFGSSTL